MGGRPAGGQRDARRETLDRIMGRRTSWTTQHRRVVDATCGRCLAVYADHDLVLSPRGRVCEACEGAIEVARVGQLQAAGGVRAVFVGGTLLGLVHVGLVASTLPSWAYGWMASLGGCWALLEGLRHLVRLQQLRATALKSETDAPPWWGTAASFSLSLLGLVSVVVAVLV